MTGIGTVRNVQGQVTRHGIAHRTGPARERLHGADYMVTGVRFRMSVLTFSRFSLGSGIRPLSSR